MRLASFQHFPCHKIASADRPQLRHHRLRLTTLAACLQYRGLSDILQCRTRKTLKLYTQSLNSKLFLAIHIGGNQAFIAPHKNNYQHFLTPLSIPYLPRCTTYCSATFSNGYNHPSCNASDPVDQQDCLKGKSNGRSNAADQKVSESAALRHSDQ